MTANPLFAPFQCRSLALPNRVVMAPMTRYASPGGIPTDEVAAYYRRRAEGGVGLIITEGVGVDRPASLNHPDIPRFHGTAALAGWSRVAQAVHKAGGRIAPQLWHVGAVPDLAFKSEMPAPSESPSGLYKPETPIGGAMDEAAIEATIAAFAHGARDAQRLGFECIELHAAHGYLFDQFFWPPLNQRDDRYGGATIAERVRFAVETIRAVRDAVGADFVLILRISQWKAQDFAARIADTADALEQWLGPLADAGIDIFHCSQRRFWEPEFGGSRLNLAGWVKKLTGRPTITVGSVGLSTEFMSWMRGEAVATSASLDELLDRLERKEFDLVAVGRALLSDPDWLLKIREDRSDELLTFDASHLQTLY